MAEQAQANLGMDYAWLEGVTYMDWQRYHDLMRGLCYISWLTFFSWSLCSTFFFVCFDSLLRWLMIHKFVLPFYAIKFCCCHEQHP